MRVFYEYNMELDIFLRDMVEYILSIFDEKFIL